MSLLTDEEVKEIRLSIPAVCHHADLIRHTEKFIESKFSALRAEIESLKQQVEQGKRDAVQEDIRKDAESWRAYKKRKDEVIAAGMGRKILRDAAAPKQEK